MNHLDQLGALNRSYAYFNLAVGVICAIGLGWMAQIGYTAGDSTLGALMIGTAVFVLVLIGVFVALFFITGSKVAEGQWRMVQTVLAVLNLGSNPPVGTAYGAYALWVCWSDPGAKARFEGTEPPAEPAPTDNRFYKIARGLVVGFGIFYTILTIGTFVAVGYLMAWGGQETEVTVQDGKIAITGMYGEELAKDEITKIELRDELPKITLRTNGYALGGTLKGWFATEDIGEVKLFVEGGAPPYIYIQGPEHWTVIGFKDPERTRKLYDELSSL